LFQKISQTGKNLSFRKEKYSDETTISQILKEHYIGENQKYIEEDLQFFEKQGIETLGDCRFLLSDESKKIFRVILKDLLDKLLEKTLEDFIDITSLDKVQPKVFDQPFVEREEEMKIIENIASLNYSSFLEAKEKDTEKQKHIFTIINGGSGSGKTRICHEFAQHLKHCTHVDDCFQNTIMIYIDFSNNSQLLREEKDVNQILGLRLFLIALTESGSIDELTMKGFDLKNFLEKKAFLVENVLNLIASTYHKLLNSVAPIPVVIACEEFQYVIREFPNNYKEIYRVLGGYMTAYNNSYRKNFSQNNLVIFPVILGTITKNEVVFDLDYHSLTLSLSPLTWNGIQKVLNYYKINQSFFDTNEKIRFWTLAGMIPRALHYSIEIIKEAQHDTFTATVIDSLFREIDRVLTTYYLEHDTGIKCSEFDFYLISGCKANMNSQWVREKTHKGIIFSHNSRLLLPYPYFTNLILEKYEPNLIPPFNSFFTWRNFVSLTFRVIFSNLYGRKNLNLETLGFVDRIISIQDLFPGAHINPSIIETKLNLIYDLDFPNKNMPLLKGTMENPEYNNFEFFKFKTMVIQEPKSSMLVDGIISHPSPDKNTLFLIHFKEKEKLYEESVSLQGWISKMRKVEQLKELKDFKLIFVYITNANIQMKTKEIMEQIIPIVIIDQMSIEEFFSPNLYPYVKYVHDGS
jgi:hypothetical protein